MSRPSNPARSPAHVRRLGAVLALSLASSPVVAGDSTVNVLTLDTSRTSVCTASDGTEVDFNLATGSFFETLRLLVLDDESFGPDGVVDRSVELLPSVPCLSAATLADADLVLLGPASADGALTPCEERLLATFVSQGGAMLVIENNASRTLAPIVGASEEIEDGFGPVTVVEAGSPVNDGPFGVVSGPFTFAYHRTCPDVGPNGSAFIASSGPVGMLWTLGAGRAIGFNDEEWIGDVQATPCGAGQQPEVMRQAMLLNAMAALIPAPDFAFVPKEVAADVDCSGAVDFADLLAVLASWGPCEGDVGCPPCPTDLDGDDETGFDDLLAVLAAFGR